MEITFDEEADALYIKFGRGKCSRNKKMDKDTILDLDSKGRVLGIEMLNASKRMSHRELMGVSVKMPLVAHN